MVSPERAVKLGILSKQGEHCHPKQLRSLGITVINTAPGAIKLYCAANLIQIEYALTNAIAYPHNMHLTLMLFLA